MGGNNRLGEFALALQQLRLRGSTRIRRQQGRVFLRQPLLSFLERQTIPNCDDSGGFCDEEILVPGLTELRRTGGHIVADLPCPHQRREQQPHEHSRGERRPPSLAPSIGEKEHRREQHTRVVGGRTRIGRQRQADSRQGRIEKGRMS